MTYKFLNFIFGVIFIPLIALIAASFTLLVTDFNAFLILLILAIMIAIPIFFFVHNFRNDKKFLIIGLICSYISLLIWVFFFISASSIYVLPKGSASMTNHRAIVAYLNSEFTKCTLGEAHLIFDTDENKEESWKCYSDPLDLQTKIVDHLNLSSFKNVHTKEDGVISGIKDTDPPLGNTSVLCITKSEVSLSCEIRTTFNTDQTKIDNIDLDFGG